MIYTFTPQERKKLEKFDLQEMQAQKVLAAALDEHGKDSKEAQEAKTAYRVQSERIKKRFFYAFEELEKARFSALETPADIIADARQAAADALIYAYVRVYDLLDKKDLDGDRIPIVDLFNNAFSVYPLNWDFEHEFLTEKEAGAADKKILFSEEGAKHYIYGIIERHAAALPNEPEKTELKAAIYDILNNSPYIMGRLTNSLYSEEATSADKAIYKLNMPIYHGKASRILASVNNGDIIKNTLANVGIIKNPAGGYKLTITDIDKLKGSYGVNIHKLFSVAVAEFTQNNNYGKGGTTNPRVSIPFLDYARLIGYDIDERQTTTPQEAEKERARIKENTKKAKKRINQDLQMMQNIRFTWKENIKGKNADFESIVLFDYIAIKQGYIIIGFGHDMAEYLRQLPETQYPRQLLTVPAKSPNAYRIGLKLAEQYNNDNNQRRGSSNRLKVDTLLKCTDLPTIEDLQKESFNNSRKWETRIKEPLENAFDVLTNRVISNWKYTRAKGEELTEQEAYNINDYETFISLYVEFELINAPDHTPRLERRAAEKAAKEAKKAAAKKKKKAPAKDKKAKKS